MNLEITFSQLEALTNPKVIDIRTPAQFAYGTYPGAENIPAEKLHPEQFRNQFTYYAKAGLFIRKCELPNETGSSLFSF